MRLKVEVSVSEQSDMKLPGQKKKTQPGTSGATQSIYIILPFFLSNRLVMVVVV